MHNKACVAGFSLLELMIFFALLAVLGAFTVPNLFKNKQAAPYKEFLTSFESLINDAVLRSIVEKKVHQIHIDIIHHLIQMRQYNPKSVESNYHKRFVPVKDPDYVVSIPFSRRFVFKNFYINQVEEMVAGTQMQDVVFYIMPDGTSQAIVANMIDVDETIDHKEFRFSFEINPFYARMTVHDTFQTP